MAIISGTPGNDTIRTAAAGGSTNGLPDATETGDLIIANEGDDVIVAGSAADAIIGGPGQDQIDAGDGNDEIVVTDIDGTNPALQGPTEVAFGETVDGGDGAEDTLLLSGVGAAAPRYDLTSWDISNVEILEIDGSAITVRLTAAQLAGFGSITGLGGTLELGDPVGLPATYNLLGKLLGDTTPVTRIVIDSPERDVIVLDHAGSDVITFEGGANDLIFLPGSISDYQGFTPGAPTVSVFAADGTQLYEIVGGGDIRFAGDEPFFATDDVIRATIDAGATEVALARLLVNDSGAGLTVISGDSLTANGGFLFPAGTPLQRFDYQPPAGFSGTDSAEYVVMDVFGRTATGTIFFDVTNTAPVAPDISLTITPGTVISAEDLVALVTDADGDGIEFSGFGFDAAELQFQPVTVPGSSLPAAIFTPVGGLTTGTVRYIVRDDSGAIGNIVGADITITFVGTGPGIARDDSLRGTIGGRDSVNVSVLEANDDAGVTITGLVGATALSATGFRLLTRDPVTNAVDATIDFNSATGEILYSGLDDAFSFDYEAVDGAGNTVTATVTVTVDNNQPQPVDLAFVMQPGVARTFQWADIISVNTDPDGDALALAAFGPTNPAFPFSFIDPAWGTLTSNFSEFTITPNAGASGPQSFFYKLVDRADLGGATRTAFDTPSGILTFTIPSGPPPVFRIEPVALSVNEGTPPAGDTSIGGTIGGAISFDIVRVSGGPAAARFELDVLAGGTNTATDDDLFAGLGRFVTSIREGRDRERVEIVIKADGAAEGNETFTFALVSATAGTVETTAFTATIVNDDGQANRAPVANPDAITILENEGFSNFHFVDVTANDSDADNDSLEVLSAAPVGGAPIVADIVNNQVRFFIDDPSGDTNGVFQLSYTVSDGEAQSVGLITVTVTPENDAPRDTTPAPGFPGRTDGVFAGTEETPLVILKSALLADDIDPDGDTPVTIASVSGVDFGTLVDNGDSFTFIPLANVAGSPFTAFTYRAQDSLGTLSDPIAVRVSLANTPDPIVANDDFLVRVGGLTPVVTAAQMLGNDIDADDPFGDTKDITAVVAGNGVLSAVLGANDSVSVTLAPDGTYAGRAFFDYTVVDSTGNSDVARVVLNRKPVAQDDSGLTAINDQGTIFVPSSLLLANDSDPDGDPLQVTPFITPSAGPFIGIETATVGGVVGTRLTLADTAYTGPAAFSYLAFDGNTNSDLKTVSLTIVPPPPPPVFTLSLIENVVPEGTGTGNGGYIIFGVQRDAASNLAAATVEVTVAPTGANPIENFDLFFGLFSGSNSILLNFLEGQDFVLFSLTIVPDAAFEPDETLSVSLASTTLGTVNTTPITAIIFNDDAAPPPPPPPPPVVSIAAETSSVGEGNDPAGIGNGMLAFAVTRTGDLSAASTVTFTVGAAPGSSAVSSDIHLVAEGGNGLGSGFGTYTATFVAGQDVERIFVIAAGDRVPEADEQVLVTLTGASGATLSTTGPLSATGTIVNDDVFPTLSLLAPGALSAFEGNAPLGGGIPLTIRRSGDTAFATEVDITVAGIGGTSAGDIGVIANGGTPLGSGPGTYTLTFNPGETDRTITIFAAGDRVPEADEQVSVTLSGARFGTLSGTQPLSQTLTFANDDVFPEIFLTTGTPSQNEGNPPGLFAMQLAVNRTGDLSYATEVTFSVAGLGTTTAADVAFVLDGGTIIGSGFGTFTVTFAPGEVSRTINVVPETDRVPEPDEQISVTLTGATSGTLSATQPLSQTLTILNDDVFPQVFLTTQAPSQNEGNPPGLFAMQLAVNRTGDLNFATAVTFSVAGLGTTTAADVAFVTDGGTVIGSGFGSFTITFAPGEASRTISVVPDTDRVPEPDEQVSVTLTGATSGTLSATQPLSQTLTILNDDVFPTVSIAAGSPTSANEGDSGPGGTIPVIISRVGDLGYATEVTFSVGGTGAAGSAAANDIAIVASGGTPIGGGFGTFSITFAAGEQSRTINIVANGDTRAEPDESFVVTLLDADRGTLTTTGPLSVTGTFLDDDTPNSAPVAIADSFSVHWADVLSVPARGVLANDVDPNADAIQAVAFQGPSANGGEVSMLANGSFTYTPPRGFVGSDTFTYRITDGALTSGTATVTIAVTNTAPVAVGESFVTRPGQTLTIAEPGLLANDTDADGDPLIVFFVTQGAQGGTVEGSFGGGFTYTPPPGFSGIDTVTYTVFDGVAISAEATITITVVNTAPVAVNDSITTRAGQAITLPASTFLANDTDADGDALSLFLISQGAQGGTVEAPFNGFVTYTPPAGFVGTDTITYQVTDGVAVSAAATITVTVVGDNAAPTDIALSNASVLETLPAGTLVGLLSATDTDAGETLAFAFAPGGNAGGLFRIDGNRLLTDAVLDHEAAATRGITLRVTDSAGNSYDEAFSIAVGNLAEGGPGDAVAPVVVNGPGFTISNGNTGPIGAAAPGGPPLASGALATVDVAPITLPGEATQRARIESEGGWNALKNLVLGPEFWSPALGTDVLLANFVDVRWDLSTAPALDFDVTVVAAKRGAIAFSGGDDVLTWVFHSNEGLWNNTAAVTGGAGDDRLVFTAVGLSGLDEALLADNADPSNDPAFYTRTYDGRFSTADAAGGAGDDVISAAGRVRLLADGGVGNDTITGALGADVIIGGDGNDILAGGGGPDRFRFDQADGLDVIADFSRAGGDRVVLVGGTGPVLAGSSFTFGATTVTATNGHVWAAGDFLFA
jgi:hypothetical protein